MLSTRTSGLDGCECTILAMRLMSMRRNVGFVGDSIQISCVCYQPTVIKNSYAFTNRTLVLSRNASKISSSPAFSKSKKVVSNP